MTASRAAAVALTTAIATAMLTACTDPAPATRRVRVLFTTDEHSHLSAIAPELDDRTPALGTGALVGGVLRRATVLSREKADGLDTLTVSTGDWSQGTLATAAFAKANFDLTAMKLLGYDAVGLGNHEFDQGPGLLAMALAAAKANGPIPPLVLTNVRFSGTSADAALAGMYGARGSGKEITASRIVTTASGLRVGVVMAMGPGAAYDCSPTAAPVTFTEGIVPSAAYHAAALGAVAAVTQREIDSLRAAAVDVVLLLGHGGIGHTASVKGDDELLVARLRGVDLVVSGHTHEDPRAVRWATALDGRQVPVLQPAAYGAEVGRAELVLEAGQAPVLDTGRVAFIPVDDQVAASTDPALRGLLAAVVDALESRHGAPMSFLEATLTAVEAQAGGAVPVVHDPGAPGDLYYYPLGQTDFDVIGLAPGETAAINLDTDAMLEAANTFGGATLAALQASGAIRGDLRKGATRTLAFADVYRMVPLGLDPVGLDPAALDPMDGMPGYPLVRFHLTVAEVRAALELTLGMSYGDGDFYVSPAGLQATYDPTRPPLDPTNLLGPGWITWLGVQTPLGVATLYDATHGFAPVNPLGAPIPTWMTPIPLVSTYQVGAFAVSMGIAPKNADGSATTLAASVLRRGDGSTVKDHQALAAFIKRHATANGGKLPSAYDATTTTSPGAVPRRICLAGAPCYGPR